ncbi:MAG: hypothetical protein FWC92_05620 [Defluviitaleaceae bacterium]|nr:hypothetical protein [Defluviitaleaceae bacterium]
MRKWLKSAWGISIVTALFSFILTVSYDWLGDRPIFSTMWSLIIIVWRGIVTFLNFELRVWWIIVGVFTMIVIAYIWSRISDTSNPAPFLSYRKDSIKGWNWEWRWYKNHYGKWDIDGLHPVCPKCETPIVESFNIYNIAYNCLRCNYSTKDRLPNFEHIKVVILDNIKKDIYK